MDVLHKFFKKHVREGIDVLSYHEHDGTGLLELTRSTHGLYIRIVTTRAELYSLHIVKDGGEKPKQVWFDGEATAWENISRGDVRERCKKALRY